MAFITTTNTSPVASPFDIIARSAVRLLNWLIRLDARYREARRMEQLTNDERRDMGMPLRIDPPRLPDMGW
jgi:hypothetical protein